MSPRNEADVPWATLARPRGAVLPNRVLLNKALASSVFTPDLRPSARCSLLTATWNLSNAIQRKHFEANHIKDATFLLAVGSFLLTVELFYLQLTILVFLLTGGAFLLAALPSLLAIGAFFAYSGESASNKGLVSEEA